MLKIYTVLICFVCASYERLVEASVEQVQSRNERRRLLKVDAMNPTSWEFAEVGLRATRAAGTSIPKPSRALSRLLLELAPAGAFNPVSLGTRLRRAYPSQLAITATAAESEDALLSLIRSHGGGASVKAVERDGLRGLAATRSAEIGDVVLEVPLELCIFDIGQEEEKLPGAPPSWMSKLPWNIQLATLLQQRRRASDKTDHYVELLPERPQTNPVDASDQDLEYAGDPMLEQFVMEGDQWLASNYNFARMCAASSQGVVDEKADFASPEDFRESMAFVSSRSIAVDAGNYGNRHLLVPILDLANHEHSPATIFAYSNASRCGPSVRLYATRPIKEGDDITMSYGQQANDRFAMFYGFIPQFNPDDGIPVTLAEVFGSVPEEMRGPEPKDGWSALFSQVSPEAMGDRPLTDTFILRAHAPDPPLFRALAEVLPENRELGPREAVAALAIEISIELIYQDSDYGYDPANLDAEEDAAIEKDEALLRDDRLSDVQSLFVQLRLSKKRTLASLRRVMRDCRQKWRTLKRDEAAAALNAFLEEVPELPPVYPNIMSEEAVAEFNARQSQVWDWEKHAFI